MDNLTVNDFFCGCGGMAIGFMNAGFSIAGAWDIDKYAVKTYAQNVGKHVQQKDIKSMSISDIPQADVWTFGFPCFEKGVLVMTDKGYKNIEDIQAGDKVLTHTNQFQSVVSPMKKYCEKLYEVNIYGSEKIKVTEEHPFYVRKINDKDKNIIGQPEWIKAADLDKNCYVGIAINQEARLPKWEEIIQQSELKSEKDLKPLDFENNDFWWIVGRYLRTGKILDNSKATTIRCMKKETAEVIQKLKKLFLCLVTKGKNIDKIYIMSKELTFYLKRFGTKELDKELTSDIFNLPDDLLKSFLDGYFSFTKPHVIDCTKITIANKKLAYGIQACIHKVYKKCCIVHHSGKVPRCITQDNKAVLRNTYFLVFNEKTQTETFYENGMMWVPFVRKKLINYHDFVYNMEVENDNSYTVNNLIVHNCQDVSVAGNMSGIAVKCQECGSQFDIKNLDSFDGCCINCKSKSIKPATRSGLFFEIIRLLDEAILFDKSKIPKILVAENVKALKPYLPLLETEFCKRGYTAYSALYNSKHWGVAQHRERYFIVGVHHSISKKFAMPVENKTRASKLSDFLDRDVPEKYYISEDKAAKIISQALEKLGHLEHVHATLTPARVNKRQEGRRAKKNEEPMFTLTAQDLHGIIIDDTFGYDKEIRLYLNNAPTLRHSRQGIKTIEKSPTYRVRNLTPTEYGRLQGFPMDRWIQVVSDSQAYKQFGNAVTTNIVEAIAKEIKKLLSD